MSTANETPARTDADRGIPVIEVTDLRRKFGSREVLRGISFKVYKGDTMIIMGGSVAENRRCSGTSTAR